MNLVCMAGPGSRLYVSAPVDSEEYDGLTPTIYAHPTTEQGSGDGSSEANAQTLASALSDATAGDIIGVLPGTGTGTVPGADQKRIPAFRTSNSGTNGNPIIIVGKYPWTHENKTELRSGGVVDAEGCPAFGSSGVNYVEWINLYVDEANSSTETDTGPVVLWDTTGSAIKKCRIIGKSDYLALDNHNGIRFEGAIDCSAHDNTISGFYSGAGATNGTGIMVYGGENLSILRNHIYDCYTGFYIKGSAQTVLFNWGQVAYNRIHDIAQGMRLGAIDAVDTLTVEHNLIYDYSDFGISLTTSAGADTSRNLLIRRNTFVTDQETANNAFYVKAITGSSVSFNDNLIAIYTSTGQNYMDGGEYTANGFAAFDYNGFYGSTDGTPWSWNSANQADISALHSAIANSNNNQVLGNNPLSGQGTGDFTVTGDATTASSTGGPIGADYSLVVAA